MKQKDIFYIGVSSFVVIVIWIAANLLHIQNTSKISEAIVLQSTPITPLFDKQTLTKLKERSPATPDFVLKSTASQTATLTPTPTIQGIPTPTTITPLTPAIELIPTVSPSIKP
jgi:hypothetical protein